MFAKIVIKWEKQVVKPFVVSCSIRLVQEKRYFHMDVQLLYSSFITIQNGNLGNDSKKHLALGRKNTRYFVFNRAPQQHVLNTENTSCRSYRGEVLAPALSSSTAFTPAPRCVRGGKSVLLLWEGAQTVSERGCAEGTIEGWVGQDVSEEMLWFQRNKQCLPEKKRTRQN